MLGISSQRGELCGMTIAWDELSLNQNASHGKCSWTLLKDSAPVTLAAGQNNECRASQGVFEIDHKFVIAAAVKSHFEEP
jgi:hypothetical protein